MQVHSIDIRRRIVAAKLFIDGHFDEPIGLEDMARQAYLSRFYFHRLFTRIYRKTPHQYLTQKRLEAARMMLEKEGIRVTDVCNRIGFDSLGSFSSLFRKQNGYSPQYYRNIAWLKKKLAKEEPRQFIPHCFIEQFKIGE